MHMMTTVRKVRSSEYCCCNREFLEIIDLSMQSLHATNVYSSIGNRCLLLADVSSHAAHISPSTNCILAVSTFYNACILFVFNYHSNNAIF